MHDKRNPIRRALAGVLLLVLGLGGGFFAGLLWQNGSPQAKKLEKISSCIDAEYLYGQGPEKAEDWLYSGLLAYTGDPYAAYYSPKQWAREQEIQSGNYAGIGATISEDKVTGEKVIMSLMAGGPAEKAGVRAQDILLAVDGASAPEIDLDTLIGDYIAGEAGTAVELRFFRPETGEELELSVIRGEIHTETVAYELLEAQIGCIVVTEFSDSTAADFKAAVDALEARGITALLLDLRGNPGGDLDAVVEIADYLLPENLTENARAFGQTTVAYMENKRKESESYFAGDGHSVDMPTAVLLDRNSASASELLSGALRDNGRAVLVGENSFGKGIVQRVFELEDGSAFKMTISQYFTPGGIFLQGLGLAPDVEIPGAMESVDALPQERLHALRSDGQVQAAIEAIGEIREGKRILVPLSSADNEIAPPDALLEAAAGQACKKKHLTMTRSEAEALVTEQLGGQVLKLYSREDRWGDSPREAGQWETELVFAPLEEDAPRPFAFWSTDLLSQSLHKLEIGDVPAEEGADLLLPFLNQISPSTGEKAQALREFLLAAAKETAEQKYQGEGYVLKVSGGDGLITAAVMPE